MFYPTAATGLWPNPYQISAQPQTGIPAVYYQMPEVAAPQTIPTVYYQTPAITAPPIPTATTSEVVVQPPAAQTNATTTTKTVTTRVLEPAQPAANTTTITERPQNRPYGVRASSSSTYSDITTTSTDSTITPRPPSIKPNPLAPIHTTTLAPVHRIVHRPYTPSGYVSSELDYGRRRIYKTDYKYRHYYCCNICKGRWDLHNRSYSYCEWFYGCPFWSLLICTLFLLALLASFFALFALQPSLNPTRFTETAETRLYNRTQVIYGFYQNCGYQTNVTNFTLTTLILCANTGTTTTARIQLSPFYSVISGSEKDSCEHLLVYFIFFLGLKLYK